MTLEEYVEAQARIVAWITQIALSLLAPFRFLPILPRDWRAILVSLYPHVEWARRESARLARQFYDSQRATHGPGGRHAVDLAGYDFAWFEEAMQPARSGLMRPRITDEAISTFVLRVVKEVENGGRRTLLRAVRSDRAVRGWARVATGRETCGFCMMLVSRGPVYSSAEDAGLDTDDTTALELIDRGDEQALNELMTRWHPGCDCKVVPVFDRRNWPGREAYLRAERLWARVTKGLHGRDALNAFRRAVERGEVDTEQASAA